MELQEKTAVVTGVSKGIGKALTEALLAEGVAVHGWGRTEPTYTHTAFTFRPCDLRDFQSVEAAAQSSMAAWGHAPDIVVNNAGLGYFAPLEELSLEQWHEMIDINLNAVYYVLKALLPAMKARQKGHVVNMASLAALDSMAQGGGYNAAKHALRGLTNALFREVRDYGIKVTGVYPGSVQTDFFDHAPGIDPHPNMMQPQDVARQVIQALQTPDNFLVDHIQFRPLQPKPPR
jgi:NADP-dependent 3-hydroxy acid dehydrogenase YdfG